MDQCEEKLMKKDSEPDLCSLKKTHDPRNFNYI